MRSRVGGLPNGDSVVTIECPQVLSWKCAEPDECGCDLQVTTDGTTYTVHACENGCELSPRSTARAIELATAAYDNYDGPPDGEEWSGGFAEHH